MRSSTHKKHSVAQVLTAALTAALVITGLSAVGNPAQAASGFMDGSPSRVPASTSAPANSYSRIGGSDRYATSANTALKMCSNGCDRVFIASGANFADALAVSALAIHKQGVVLLARPDKVDAVTRSALQKIRPTEVVIAGGSAALSDNTYRQVQSAAPSAKLKRVAGSTRYETSRKLAEMFSYTQGFYFTSGLNWPDALAASQFAGVQTRPLILTPGNKVDSDTASWLRSHKPAYVESNANLFIGGRWSDATRNVARNASGVQLERIFSGKDRYETATQMLNAYKAKPAKVTYTTGLNYADALGASVLAVKAGAPLVLARQNCVTPTGNSYTQYAKGGFLMGGDKVVSNGVPKNACEGKRLSSSTGGNSGKPTTPTNPTKPPTQKPTPEATSRPYPTNRPSAKLPANAPEYLKKARQIMDDIGGYDIVLTEMTNQSALKAGQAYKGSGFLERDKSRPGAPYTHVEVTVEINPNFLSYDGYLQKWFMLNMLAFQRWIWLTPELQGSLFNEPSAQYASLFGSNYKNLTYCMAKGSPKYSYVTAGVHPGISSSYDRFYAPNNDTNYCTTPRLNFAASMWKGKVPDAKPQGLPRAASAQAIGTEDEVQESTMFEFEGFAPDFPAEDIVDSETATVDVDSIDSEDNISQSGD